MKINKVQNNQNTNFKARFDVRIAKDYVDYLKKVQIEAPLALDGVIQGILNTASMLKGVAPIIGDNSDVLLLSSQKNGHFDLKFNGRKVKDLYPSEYDMPEDTRDAIVYDITRGVLEHKDLNSVNGKNYLVFPSTQIAEGKFGIEATGKLKKWDGEWIDKTVTPDEMIERVMKLDTMV